VTNTPHDALFKAIFGQPEHAAAELQHLLPGGIAARVDWASLALEPGSYVDDELADQHSDLLFSATERGSGERTLVYLLFEHQSSAEPTMALRLLGYMVRIWTRHTRDHPGTALPLVIPALLAHAPGGWRATTQFSDLFSPSAAATARACIPDFRYFVDDLHRTDDAQLQQRPLAEQARLALWLLRDARDAAVLLRTLTHWASVLESLAQRPDSEDSLPLLLRYVLLVSGDLRLSEFRAILSTRAPTVDMTTIAEQLRAEGHAVGHSIGKAEGKLDAVLVLLRARGLHIDAEQLARLQGETDAETLDRWLVRAASATAVATLFED
jgi:predicted transposase/invertase (TIGR01784 family)